jgi:phosphatidylinositol alpha 1,6-mannosyltransferase
VKDGLRAALFADSFLEVDGVAMTCKRLVDFAERRDLPFLCVYAGPQTETRITGTVTRLSLKRSPVAIPLDETLGYDPFFQRHTNLVLRRLMDFKPDVIHITGINDVSIIGSYLAWKLKVPLVGSWHTNVHEFAAMRVKKLLGFLPSSLLDPLARGIESSIMRGSALYYKMPKVILSPNQERRTNRESRLMARGVDADFFSPAKRTASDDVFRIGYVGRLRAEKNLGVLVDVERAFAAAGVPDFEILIVGEGSERNYLESNLTKARFTGFLAGDQLAQAYANMDVFVFPSETETFGNVVTEANSSGVPAIVSDKGGPKFIIEEGKSGLIARQPTDYAAFALALYRDRARLAAMKAEARRNALARSWDSIFESVYEAYDFAVRNNN